MSQYLRLPAIDWPQDKARVPAGVGGMPPIEYNNRARIEAEFCSFVGLIVIPSTAVQGNVFSTIIPTDQDGDFWCDEISMQVQSGLADAQSDLDAPGSYTSITDIRTGQLLTYPYIPTNIFKRLTFNLAYVSPSPGFFRDTSTLIQPYCFTRQGGIAISVVLKQPRGVIDQIYFCLSGWKEYANASR